MGPASLPLSSDIRASVILSEVCGSSAWKVGVGSHSPGRKEGAVHPRSLWPSLCRGGQCRGHFFPRKGNPTKRGSWVSPSAGLTQSRNSGACRRPGRGESGGRALLLVAKRARRPGAGSAGQCSQTGTLPSRGGRAGPGEGDACRGTLGVRRDLGGVSRKPSCCPPGVRASTQPAGPRGPSSLSPCDSLPPGPHCAWPRPGRRFSCVQRPRGRGFSAS